MHTPVNARLWAVAAALLLGLAHHTAAAKEAIYFSLQGDGTASAIVDDAAQTAYIADGGRSGASGISGATIDGVGVLDYLRKKKISRLVISCSHPHEDHMGGLRDLVRDPRICRFAVTFVDNGVYPAGVVPLHRLYQDNCKKSQAEMKERYISTMNEDAFRRFSRDSASVRVSNYIYDPAEIGEDIHDASIIMQYDIGTAQQSSRVVDFDDSSQKLINRWARPVRDAPPPRVDVLIHPHHGSRNNLIDAILDKAKDHGLRDVVITVNDQNRFLHPSPEVLLKLFETVGPDHVYVTGSTPGDNVVIGVDGVVAREDTETHRKRLVRLIDMRIEQTKSRLRARVDRLPVEASPDKDSKVKRYLRSIAALQAARSIAGGRPDERSDIVASSGRGFEPPAAANRAPSSEGPSAGPSGGGSGAYIDEVKRQGRASPTPSGDTVGRGSGRIAAFEDELRGAPNWGGVIIGNATDGDKLRSIEFIQLPAEEQDSDEEPVFVIRITTTDGRKGDYAAVTPSELWSAHRYVQPTADVAGSEEDARALENAIGLVGISGDMAGQSVWSFNIAPAIADTPLAEDAMRLDMAIVAARAPARGVPKPDYVRGLTLLDNFNTYQWYDSKSRVTVESNEVIVVAQDEPAGCLMRVRLVSVPTTDEELMALIAALPEAQQLALLQSIMQGQNDPGLKKEMVEQLQVLVKSRPGLGRSLEQLCESFDALRNVDRFAMIVAVLNRYRDSTGKPLPELPTSVTPLKRSVPAEWPMERVFQAATTQTSEPEPPVAPQPAPEPEPPRKPWWRSNWYWIVGGLFVLVLGGVLLRRRMA